MSAAFQRNILYLFIYLFAFLFTAYLRSTTAYITSIVRSPIKATRTAIDQRVKIYMIFICQERIATFQNSVLTQAKKCGTLVMKNPADQMKTLAYPSIK